MSMMMTSAEIEQKLIHFQNQARKYETMPGGDAHPELLQILTQIDDLTAKLELNRKAEDFCKASSFETEAVEPSLIRRRGRVVQFDGDQVVLRDEKHGRDVRERKAHQNLILESLQSCVSSEEEMKVGTVDTVDLSPLERENAELKCVIEQQKLEIHGLVSKLVERLNAGDPNFSVFLLDSVNRLSLCKRLEVNKALAKALAENEASIKRSIQEAEAETRDKEEAIAETERLDKMLDEITKKRNDAARRAGRFTKVITNNE